MLFSMIFFLIFVIEKLKSLNSLKFRSFQIKNLIEIFIFNWRLI